MTKRNQYRAWSGDGKALSQMTYRPPTIWQECKNCHQQFPLEPTQHMWVHEVTDLRGGLCLTCTQEKEDGAPGPDEDELSPEDAASLLAQVRLGPFTHRGSCVNSSHIPSE